MTPTWRLTIYTDGIKVTSPDGVQPLVVEGSGPLPQLVALGVIFPPPPFPPPPPPVVVPPPEDEDDRPFVFPTGGPSYDCRDFDRFYPLDRTGMPGADYYAVEQDAGRPGRAHKNAGIIGAEGRTAYGLGVGGLRLWVRFVAGEDALTGKPLPEASGRLIRRALKLGHL